MNRLFYGDNLQVLREHVATESVDLIYLDPPFNSNRSYNVLFKTKRGDDAQAQIEAFDDTWTWDQHSENAYDELVRGGAPTKVADAIEAMRRLLGENDMLAYLVMMTERLVELHRVLKSTGSLYLHCDPTASHYLKVMLDSIFGPQNFLNEVVWLYGLGGSSHRYWPKKHDVLLWYSRTPDGQVFEADMIPATSNRMKGELKKAPDYWDIPAINNMAKERLGYPTQKPLALLERIVRSSSPPGGLVLDPFCGCGTTIDAAQKLGRAWIGIDISTLAVDLIRTRLQDTYGSGIASSYELVGLPKDIDGARELFSTNAFDFERWAVGLVDAQANEKQVGDKGIDGVIRFPLDTKAVGRAVVSVKGGATLNPAMVRDLRGTIETQKAELGIFICLTEPTRGMIEEANKSGSYVHGLTGTSYPRLQLITVKELLDGKRPAMPSHFLPYVQAKRLVADNQISLFDSN